jgi:hypothetical protein
MTPSRLHVPPTPQGRSPASEAIAVDPDLPELAVRKRHGSAVWRPEREGSTVGFGERTRGNRIERTQPQMRLALGRGHERQRLPSGEIASAVGSVVGGVLISTRISGSGVVDGAAPQRRNDHRRDDRDNHEGEQPGKPLVSSRWCLRSRDSERPGLRLVDFDPRVADVAKPALVLLKAAARPAAGCLRVRRASVRARFSGRSQELADQSRRRLLPLSIS